MSYELYSKEVMKHFKKPMNMGKIKNSDGVGKVGNLTCGDIMYLYIKVKKSKLNNPMKNVLSDIKFETFGCLPSHEKIVTNEGGWENISQIGRGHTVINKDGRETLVTKKYLIPYDGLLLTFTPFVSPFNRFSVTPEHPILCVKRSSLKKIRKNSKCKWLRISADGLTSTLPDYVEAKKIEEGDYLVFAFNRKIKDYKIFTKELMRLLGYYLSKGYFACKGSLVAFAFNKNEKEPIEEVKYLIKKITGKDAKVRIRKNVGEVYVCSRKLCRLLKLLCGSIAKNKSISKDILSLPPEKQWQMISTWLIGDGDSYRRRPKNFPTYKIATSSEPLAIQLQEMLARRGIFSSIRETKVSKNFIDGREIKGSKLFMVTFRLERKHTFVHSNKNYFLVPIKKIEKISYEGTVHNLEVSSNSHSYLVKGFVVHNCVAAIATSSMITKLAKGKTIEEALKITKIQVANALGGLPQVKMHCSILANDALNEAIYDYLTKNKLTIPEELEKRHQQIKKETEFVEEKFKDYVEMEKEILSSKKE